MYLSQIVAETRKVQFDKQLLGPEVYSLTSSCWDQRYTCSQRDAVT